MIGLRIVSATSFGDTGSAAQFLAHGSPGFQQLGHCLKCQMRYFSRSPDSFIADSLTQNHGGCSGTGHPRGIAVHCVLIGRSATRKCYDSGGEQRNPPVWVIYTSLLGCGIAVAVEEGGVARGNVARARSQHSRSGPPLKPSALQAKPVSQKTAG